MVVVKCSLYLANGRIKTHWKSRSSYYRASRGPTLRCYCLHLSIVWVAIADSAMDGGMGSGVGSTGGVAKFLLEGKHAISIISDESGTAILVHFLLRRQRDGGGRSGRLVVRGLYYAIVDLRTEDPLDSRFWSAVDER